MIVIRCPYCLEQKTEEELNYGGEANIVRASTAQHESNTSWTDYLFMRLNPKGVVIEHWCCAFGCGQWFKARRHTETHEVTAVERVGVTFGPDVEDSPLDGIPRGKSR